MIKLITTFFLCLGIGHKTPENFTQNATKTATTLNKTRVDRLLNRQLQGIQAIYQLGSSNRRTLLSVPPTLSPTENPTYYPTSSPTNITLAPTPNPTIAVQPLNNIPLVTIPQVNGLYTFVIDLNSLFANPNNDTLRIVNATLQNGSPLPTSMMLNYTSGLLTAFNNATFTSFNVSIFVSNGQGGFAESIFLGFLQATTTSTTASGDDDWWTEERMYWAGGIGGAVLLVVITASTTYICCKRRLMKKYKKEFEKSQKIEKNLTRNEESVSDIDNSMSKKDDDR